MKFLIVCLLISLPVFSQNTSRSSSDPDLVVLKFNWNKYHDTGGLIHGVQDEEQAMNGPVPSPIQPRRTETDRLASMRDLQERRGELHVAEKVAANSASRSSDYFVYRLQFRNEGTKVVKGVIWAYQPLAAGADAVGRVFFCRLKAKPGEEKLVQALSTFAPSKVVDARAKNVDPQAKDNVVVESIEYADGTVWHRAGWNPAILSGVTGRKINNGLCVAI